MKPDIAIGKENKNTLLITTLEIQKMPIIFRATIITFIFPFTQILSIKLESPVSSFGHSGRHSPCEERSVLDIPVIYPKLKEKTWGKPTKNSTIHCLKHLSFWSQNKSLDKLLSPLRQIMLRNYCNGSMMFHSYQHSQFLEVQQSKRATLLKQHRDYSAIKLRTTST